MGRSAGAVDSDSALATGYAETAVPWSCVTDYHEAPAMLHDVRRKYEVGADDNKVFANDEDMLCSTMNFQRREHPCHKV